MIVGTIHSFEQWRQVSRQLLQHNIPPEQTHWQTETQNELFGNEASVHDLNLKSAHQNTPPFKVSKEFIDLASTAACYRCDKRWALLYRVLWRLTHGEPYLLKIASDDDIRLLSKMEKEVRRDSHKMKAFVRFRKMTKKVTKQTDNNGIVKSENEKEFYLAWHQPSHFTLARTAPFFVRRFAAMNWAILTPDLCAYWDGDSLRFNEGLSRQQAKDETPAADEMEDLWKTFYWNIFNPARIKVNMMKSEMPMKFWHTLPEAQLIPDMLNTASSRVEEMIKRQRENNE